jgi:hypothetical protein
MFYRLVLVTEYTRFTSMSIKFYKVSFGKSYTSTKIPRENLSFTGIFIFQIFLLLSTRTSGKIRALYIESTEQFTPYM